MNVLERNIIAVYHLVVWSNGDERHIWRLINVCSSIIVLIVALVTASCCCCCCSIENGMDDVLPHTKDCARMRGIYHYREISQEKK